MLKEPKSNDIYNLALKFDKVLGLSLDKFTPPAKEEAKIDVPEEINALIEERKQAKKDKNFALADEIRSKINSLGYEVKDTREGTVVTKL